ncbi:MAG: acetyl-CoA carboxylase carboxyl transferase subunit alpha, partial [Evtepia sp.]
LKTPIITVLIGEGGSGGALALSVADRVWMLENAVYSVISPEGCASILWKDASRAADAAQSLKLTAKDALSFSVIERILSERALGTKTFYDSLQTALSEELNTLSALPIGVLLEERYQRFRVLGRDGGREMVR